MTTKTAEPIDLPPPVAAYFAAEIARWKAEAPSNFRYSVERLGGRVSGDQITVTGRVTGDFPASPVELRYHFSLEGDKIARLEIAP